MWVSTGLSISSARVNPPLCKLPPAFCPLLRVLYPLHPTPDPLVLSLCSMRASLQVKDLNVSDELKMNEFKT